MYSIIRREPFRDMVAFRNAMDRRFDDAFIGTRWEWQPHRADFALDVAETGDEYLVKASIPGINPEDLDITFVGKILTIKGEYKEKEEKEDVHYHHRERRFGSFSRNISLPTAIKSDDIKASYEDGVVTLQLPKTEEVKPKRIAVHSVETPKLIEGQAADIAKNKN